MSSQHPNRPPQVRQQVSRLPRARGMRRAIHPQLNCPPQVPQVRPLQVRLRPMQERRALFVRRQQLNCPPQVRPRWVQQVQLRLTQARRVHPASSQQLNRPPQVQVQV